MNPLEIIQKYYNPNTALYQLLIAHSTAVAQKAGEIAYEHPELNIDSKFVQEASMLHDIGIFLTHAPSIGCFGKEPYICHGYIGADLLRNENLPKHALVCERHTGTGINLENIINNQLPLPHRDMQPVSIEEQLICFADKFFSKSNPDKEFSLNEARVTLEKFGEDGLTRFDYWANLFL